MQVGRSVRDAISMALGHWWRFAAVMALPLAAVAAFGALVTGPMARAEPAATGDVALVTLLDLGFAAILYGIALGVGVLVAAGLHGEARKGHAARRLGNLAATSIIVTAMMAACFLPVLIFASSPPVAVLMAIVAVVIIIVLAMALLVTPAVSALETRRPMDNITRAFDLTRGSRWSIFGAAMLVGIINIVLGFAVLFGTGQVARLASLEAVQWQAGAGFLTDMAVMPIQAALIFVIYAQVARPAPPPPTPPAPMPPVQMDAARPAPGIFPAPSTIAHERGDGPAWSDAPRRLVHRDPGPDDALIVADRDALDAARRARQRAWIVAGTQDEDAWPDLLLAGAERIIVAPHRLTAALAMLDPEVLAVQDDAPEGVASLGGRGTPAYAHDGTAWLLASAPYADDESE